MPKSGAGTSKPAVAAVSDVYTATIYVAAPGTPLSEGGTSLPGHMYFEITQGGVKRSYGFAPIQHGSAYTMGKIYYNDASNYIKPRYARTMEINKTHYDALEAFGSDPVKQKFSLFYNGASNSCIDFTWSALNHAGLHADLLWTRKSLEGDLKPLDNIRWITYINDPLPKSTLNKEIWNAMPPRSVQQWLLSQNSKPNLIQSAGRRV